MKKPDVPCHNCTERCVTLGHNCHSDCERYMTYCRENNKQKAFLKEQRAKNAMMTEVTINAVKRVQRKKQMGEHQNARKGT